MNDENYKQRQDEITLEQARESKAEAHKRKLRKLNGGLRRVTLHLTETELEALDDLALSGQQSYSELLESFATDLADSSRSLWPHCRDEARSWLKAHHEGQAMVEALNAKESAAEGGEPC
jgi:hypothetical protein